MKKGMVPHRTYRADQAVGLRRALLKLTAQRLRFFHLGGQLCLQIIQLSDVGEQLPVGFIGQGFACRCRIVDVNVGLAVRLRDVLELLIGFRAAVCTGKFQHDNAKLQILITISH